MKVIDVQEIAPSCNNICWSFWTLWSCLEFIIVVSTRVWLQCNLFAVTKQTTKQDEKEEQQSNAKVLMFLFTGVRIMYYKTIMCEDIRAILERFQFSWPEKPPEPENIPSMNFASCVEFYA